jgi:hypothetical protein
MWQRRSYRLWKRLVTEGFESPLSAKTWSQAAHHEGRATIAERSETCPAMVTRSRVALQGMPSHHFYNPRGTVHGGWLSTPLDSAIACAVLCSKPSALL